MASKSKQQEDNPQRTPVPDPPASEPTDDQLRTMLAKQGKSTSGNRQALIDRLDGEPVDWTADKQ